MYGAYAELGYDVLTSWRTSPSDPQLIVFARLEKFDLNATVPGNGVKDGTLNQVHLIAGLTYLPLPSVVVKADVRVAHTGDPNPQLTAEPGLMPPAYNPTNFFLNLGIGFSF